MRRPEFDCGARKNRPSASFTGERILSSESRLGGLLGAFLYHRVNDTSRSREVRECLVEIIVVVDVQVVVIVFDHCSELID